MNILLFSLLVPATIVFFIMSFNEKAEATEAEPQLMRARVSVSTIIQSPVDEVWAIFRDFNDHFFTVFIQSFLIVRQL